jgi:hypothetical protein
VERRGIEALLLGIRHPARVKKIVAMAAVTAADRDTPRGRRELKVTGMMLEERNIGAKALSQRYPS